MVFPVDIISFVRLSGLFDAYFFCSCPAHRGLKHNHFELGLPHCWHHQPWKGRSHTILKTQRQDTNNEWAEDKNEGPQGHRSGAVWIGFSEAEDCCLYQ